MPTASQTKGCWDQNLYKDVLKNPVMYGITRIEEENNCWEKT